MMVGCRAVGAGAPRPVRSAQPVAQAADVRAWWHAESERQHVQARMRAAMDTQMVNEGCHRGGRAPHGYVAVDGGPHPNPSKAAEGTGWGCSRSMIRPPRRRGASSPNTWMARGISYRGDVESGRYSARAGLVRVAFAEDASRRDPVGVEQPGRARPDTCRR